MDEIEWHRIWIDTLTQGGVRLPEAHRAFFNRYGSHALDLNCDPKEDASLWLQPKKVATLCQWHQ